MSENQPAPDAAAQAKARRDKLVGRLAVIAFLLLVLVYVGPMLLDLVS